jgi:hypothetical protein
VEASEFHEVLPSECSSEAQCRLPLLDIDWRSVYVSKIPTAVICLVEPAVTALSARLFVLSTFRPGSAEYKPSIETFYETGIVTALYEHLLMTPVLAHLEIRHEMPYPAPTPQRGAPKRVDLWMRPVNGGYPHIVEAGDFAVGKVHKDLAKAKKLNPRGANWFLAFFRGGDQGATDPAKRVEAALNRKKGLDGNRVEFSKGLSTSFSIYRPDGHRASFGAVLLRGR